MTKSRLSPVLIIGLALILLVAAGCNRPDAQATLDTPVPSDVDVQTLPTLPPAATPTLPVNVTADDLMATQMAGMMPEPTTPEATPTPEPVTISPAESTPAPLPDISTPTPTVETPAQPVTQTVNTSGQIVYTVKPGDRLFSIARIYSINPYAIAQANNIPAPYYIYPGQQLIIPTGGSGTPPQPPPTTQPPSGQCRSYYVVRIGDNLFRIALTVGVPMAQLAAANNISNYNLIYAGQRLCVP